MHKEPPGQQSFAELARHGRPRRER
jgi:hypothetical protein